MTTGFHLLGEFKDQPECYRPLDYFESRDCWLDCRGKGMLKIHEAANLGWCVSLVTQSHNPEPGKFNDVVDRPIKIGKDAFIGYGAILYNCEIGEGSIVAVGSVVRGVVVPPWVMVEGNPAQVIKIFNPEEKVWVPFRMKLLKQRRPKEEKKT